MWTKVLRPSERRCWKCPYWWKESGYVFKNCSDPRSGVEGSQGGITWKPSSAAYIGGNLICLLDRWTRKILQNKLWWCWWWGCRWWWWWWWWLWWWWPTLRWWEGERASVLVGRLMSGRGGSLGCSGGMGAGGGARKGGGGGYTSYWEHYPSYKPPAPLSPLLTPPAFSSSLSWSQLSWRWNYMHSIQSQRHKSDVEMPLDNKYVKGCCNMWKNELHQVVLGQFSCVTCVQCVELRELSRASSRCIYTESVVAIQSNCAEGWMKKSKMLLPAKIFRGTY